MKFKEIFEPVEKLDKYILRQYNKVVNKFEKKGKSKDFLIVPLTLYYSTIPFLLSYLHAVNLWHINESFHTMAWGISKIKEENINSNEKTKNPLEYILSVPSKLLRLPGLGLGAYLGTKSVFNFYNSIASGDSSLVAEGVNDFLFGLDCFATGSVSYIKESGPKFLDKQYSLVEYLKKAGSKVKELVSPNPIPNPSPIQYYLLENRI